MKRRGQMRWLALAWLGVSPLGACREVAEVLVAPAPVALAGAGAEPQGGSAAGLGGAGGGGTAGSAGQQGLGGAAPPDPALGVFVDGGDAHSCATRFGILYCWGNNSSGRLGVGDEETRLTPTRVGFDADFVAVATGAAHSCALKVDGSVWCFGANDQGQLGQGKLDLAPLAASSVPLQVVLPGKVVQLSSEADTACAVLSNGELYCWGNNAEGNIGLNDTYPGEDQLSPVRVGELSDWKLSGTGQGHTCAVRGEGLLFGWGRNSAANLGLGQTVDQQRRAPTQIGTDPDWLFVASGQDASCGIRSAGRLFCWGGNRHATLGLGDRDDRLSPSELALPEAGATWLSVSLDTFHACAVDDAQKLYCWGRNLEGQLGTLDNEDRLVPTLIDLGPAAAAVQEVAVGRFFTCAATTDGRVLCAGAGDGGQLGLADVQRRNTFTEVTFP